MQFINKSFDGKLDNNIDQGTENKLKELYTLVGNDIDKGNTKEALSKIFEFINYANKYFDENEPWKLANDDIDKCKKILYNCSNIIFNINNLLKPYLIETTVVVEKYLNKTNEKWDYKRLDRVNLKKDIKPLFIKYDKKLIEDEREKLRIDRSKIIS